MATQDLYAQLETQHYTIVPNYDLIVRAIEREESARDEIGSDGHVHRVLESIPRKIHVFKVARAVVSSSSTYFKKLLNRNSAFRESAHHSCIDLHEDHPEAIAVWFQIMHDSSPGDSAAMKSVTIKTVWEVLAVAHKYGYEPATSKPKTWFAAWYESNVTWSVNTLDFQDHQMLLFPCHTFDHAVGFAATTKYLAYHATGHITERRPEGFEYDHLRLDSRIIQQLNAAKGRLKTILHGNSDRRREGIYSPMDQILRFARCSCKEKSLFGYMKALMHTGAWPLEIVCQYSSMDKILRGLGTFEPPERSNDGCSQCQKRFGMIVRAVVLKTRTYFDGLCLGMFHCIKLRCNSLTGSC
ncbi:hypothetical protein BDY17DRAFT_302252 [Neohortaea acidophila]|uniref:BTB domain-containing protein n=1 Tax=Neohortaea acidophila TaxID=245834 RepID=A0A6A6PL10_9PEZI|nr:uncharacterized protein BDY17DRAFT_302252 [Neohortaea acidophila]KAF2480702.1 hypothetical protein BDY17DRAFT_302252 [Neohortaea acidophila]